MEETFRCPIRPEEKEGEDKWTRNGPFRHCSYCGSMEPQDAIALARSGWTMTNEGQPDEFRLKSPHQNDYDPFLVRSLHFDDEGFCHLLSESLGGVWAKQGRKFVRSEYGT